MYLVIALLIATCVTWGAAIWASFEEENREDKHATKGTEPIGTIKSEANEAVRRQLPESVKLERVQNNAEKVYR